MSHHHTSRRSRRLGIVASGVAAVILPLGAAGTAMASTDVPGGRHAAHPSVVHLPDSPQQVVHLPDSRHTTSTTTGDTPTAVTTVRDFYQGYISALAEGHQDRAQQLRQQYLTERLRHELARWEQEHGKDALLRSEQVPTRIDVVYDGSGAGHSWTIVTLTWDDGSAPTKLHVQSDLRTQKISDIKALS